MMNTGTEFRTSFCIRFDVIVGDHAPHDWIIENIAFITTFTNSFEPYPTISTNLVEVFVENPVPEPGTIFLFSIGLVGVFAVGRKYLRK